MKKLILLSIILIVGCEGFGVFKHDHDGICVRRNGNYYCADTWTHKDCLYSEAQGSWTYAWYTDITCEEFCGEKVQDKTSNMECEIDNFYPFDF